MEAFITSLLPIIGPGGVGILAAIFVYLKIASQRKETKNERDKNLELLDYRVKQLENRSDKLDKSIEELQNSIISLTISINGLMAELKNLKRD